MVIHVDLDTAALTPMLADNESPALCRGVFSHADFPADIQDTSS
jgi:hypothetical protein